MLAFRLFHDQGEMQWPLTLYSCGLHPQHPIVRPIGYPTAQCMICFSGSGTFRFEGASAMEMKRGDILFVPSKLAHEYSPSGTEPWIIGYIGIEGDFVESLIAALRLPMMERIAVNEHALLHLESELRQLWHTGEEEGSDHHLDVSTKIYHLLAYIGTIARQGIRMPPKPNRSHSGTKEPLRTAVQYMEQHYMEELSLANIAHAVGYSKQHFQRLFKERYGMNPSAYLQRLRLLKGHQLLEGESGLSIGEIAAMVGMELNYFVRLFRQRYGETPAKYRTRYGRGGHADGNRNERAMDR
ncbi:AraC family transcriptional regulator [Paenibacillus nanensis]|uniref:AraC family transcriptional regulator n=1 Tax=Paenibacillus nanensis TaxID=393251 RepID=A0A3A1VGC5_9BACL|nr:AraC family transcriptional regulator [Paenibacillus nanensis]RIX59617.1 AraC family transcriptional regulator [Paenibacillus nanensis]